MLIFTTTTTTTTNNNNNNKLLSIFSHMNIDEDHNSKQIAFITHEKPTVFQNTNPNQFKATKKKTAHNMLLK